MSQMALFEIDVKDPLGTLLPSASATDMIVYVAGAGHHKSRTGGWTYTVIGSGDKSGYRQGRGGHVDNTTHQCMILRATIEGLCEVPSGASVKIVTTSQVLSNGINEWLRDWIREGRLYQSESRIQHADLWLEIVSLLQHYPHRAEWVPKAQAGPEIRECEEAAQWQCLYGTSPW